MPEYTHEILVGEKLHYYYRQDGGLIYNLDGGLMFEGVFSLEDLIGFGYKTREINFSIENE